MILRVIGQNFFQVLRARLQRANEPQVILERRPPLRDGRGFAGRDFFLLSCGRQDPGFELAKKILGGARPVNLRKPVLTTLFGRLERHDLPFALLLRHAFKIELHHGALRKERENFGRADLDRLSARFGVPFLRGPDELKDIPLYFGRARKAADMTKYDIQIFAEIVDASALPVETILKRAQHYVERGANVIDVEHDRTAIAGAIREHATRGRPKADADG